jgi:hypothetical protein
MIATLLLPEAIVVILPQADLQKVPALQKAGVPLDQAIGDNPLL